MDVTVRGNQASDASRYPVRILASYRSRGRSAELANEAAWQ